MRRLTLLSLAFFLVAMPPALAARPKLPPQQVGAPALITAAAALRSDIAERHGGARPQDLLLLAGEAGRLLRDGAYDEAAARLERVLAARPQDFGAWMLLALARALYWDPDFAAAAAAAQNAFEAADSDLDRAVALGLLQAVRDRETLWADPERRYRGPGGIEALLPRPDGPGEAAQRARKLAGPAAVGGRFRDLVAGYPPGLAPVQVTAVTDSDVAALCVDFNRPLARGGEVAYRDHVEIRPDLRDVAAVARKDRLCLEGLPFGRPVELVLKKGLPAAGGERLAEPVTIAQFVPSREPKLAFRERGYVLPAHGAKILPLDSVNVGRATLKLSRIAERGLAREIEDGLLRALTPHEVNAIVERRGELLFEGVFDLADRPNRTVTTGLAVEDMIGGRLAPGLYVLAAADETAPDARWEPQATQWFVVSDIGLSVLDGPDGLHVFARSFETAAPLPDVALALVARNNRVLAEAVTDAQGRARFPRALAEGAGGNAPLFVRASSEAGGFVFVGLEESAFDLSDRGVAGRAPPGPVDAFVFTERGIYRPGETVHATALARTAGGAALPGVPLTFRVLRPDGQELMRTSAPDIGMGAHRLDLPTVSASPSGRWTIEALLDPARPPVGNTTFLLADFVPPRIEVVAKPRAEALAPKDPFGLDVAARWLFGAPAGALRVAGEIVLQAADDPFPSWPGFRFGLVEEEFSPLRFPLQETVTDADGRATVTGTVGADPDTTHPLEAVARVEVFEPGGRPRRAAVRLPFRNQELFIGIKPGFAGDTAPQNGPAPFRVASVAPDGSAKAAQRLAWTLVEEDWRHVWFRSGDRWDYETVVRDTPKAKGEVTTAADGTAGMSVPVEWGRYRIEVYEPGGGAATSLRFAAGWGVAAALPDRPDLVEVTLDRTGRIAPGETVRVFVKPPFAGELLLLRAGQALRVVHSGPIATEGTTVEIPVDERFGDGPGEYLVAMVFRPGDASVRRMPGRAVGLAWLAADRSADIARLDLALPATIRPGATLEVGVTVADAREETRLVMMAVDDGVLQVTGFETPDPAAHLFAQRRLAYDIRDAWGRLIDPYGAERGVIRSGGDETSRLDPGLAVRSSKIASLYSGVVPVGPDGSATVRFDVPDWFSGRLRVMALAWDRERVGSAAAEIAVRDPVVADLTLPRFLAPGDLAEATVLLRSVDGAPGAYRLAIEVDGPLVLNAAPAAEQALNPGDERRLPLRLEAGPPGIGRLVLSLTGPEGFSVRRDWEIAVRPAQPAIEEPALVKLAPGTERRLDAALLQPFLSGTGRLTLTLGSAPSYRSPELVRQLLAYPYGCVEQTASRAVAVLHRPDALPEGERDRQLAQAVERVLAHQRRDGSFGLWSLRDEGGQWLSAYATDFLLAAREHGFPVYDAPLRRAVAWLQDSIRAGEVAEPELSGHAYAHYVTARAGAGDLSRLRHFADVYGGSLQTPMDHALLSAALARYGDVDRAEKAFEAALAARRPEPAQTPEDYGTVIRDQAAVVALLANLARDPDALQKRALELAGAVAGEPRLSTQEMVWLVRAAAALAARAGDYRAEIGGETYAGSAPVRLDLDRERLGDGVVVRNAGERALVFELAASGVPAATLPPESAGYRIARDIYTRSGRKADPAAVQQGDLLLFVLTGESRREEKQHALLVDLLPAGLEIEGGLLGKEDLPQGLLAGEPTPVRHAEARDDRFFAALDLEGGAKFRLVYAVRAVTPGSFVHPAPYIESMYQPTLRARGGIGRITIGK